jgi:hypothetical protein
MSSAEEVAAVLNSTPTETTKQASASDEPVEWLEIKQILRDAMANQPRSLQKELGPSELGTDCLHCLAAKLAGWDQHDSSDGWVPWVGTSVHEKHERLFRHLEGYMMDTDSNPLRWKPEYPVTVGHLSGLAGGYDIIGHIDLWDRKTNSTIDWKVVGPTTLKLAKANGASQTYLIQASLYGIGLMNEGEKVERSCIFFLAKTGGSLDDAYPLEFAFDPEPGYWALRRANLLATLLDLIETEAGAAMRDEWIRRLPRTNTHCFDCSKFWDAAESSALTSDFVQPAFPMPERYQTFASLLEATYTPTTK